MSVRVTGAQGQPGGLQARDQKDAAASSGRAAAHVRQQHLHGAHPRARSALVLTLFVDSPMR